MKILFILVISLFVGYNSLALGIGEWSSYTPGGNIIGNDRTTNVMSLSFSISGQNIDSIDSWYFYKNAIVGTFDGSPRYFVAGEKDLQIKIFDSREEWTQYVKNMGLAPAIWTRWYYDDWDFNTNDLTGYLMIEFLLCLILSVFILLLWCAYKQLRHQNVRWMRSYFFLVAATTTCFWALTFLNVFLSKFPQSI